MLIHYIKVALRNLLKYKFHSLISALCLAIGITCFCLTNHFINTTTRKEVLPDNEHRIRVILNSEQTGTNVYCYQADVEQLEERNIAGLDTLVASSDNRQAEITVIGKNQQELPYLIKYQCVSPNFFTYNAINVNLGNQQIKAPDEVIISQAFAQKAFGNEDPTGKIVRLVTGEDQSSTNRITDYKIAGVAQERQEQGKRMPDCYFPLSMNPHLPLSIHSYLTGQTTLEELQKQLKATTWKRGDMDLNAWANMSETQEKSIQQSIHTLMLRFIASLILVSGLINFLKFIIQMFYNRQRELALRKCMGSSAKGLYLLLATETVWMMSAAFVLSLVCTEVSISIAHTYFPEEEMIPLPLMEICSTQFGLYLFLLGICMAICLYPVFRLRQLSIIHTMTHKKGKHLFRNIMIGIQMAISVFFVGGVYGTMLTFDELFENMYSPLSPEEEKQIISMSVNSIHMQQHIGSILSDISRLPGITEQTFVSQMPRMNAYTYMNYTPNDKPAGMVIMSQGDPGYFDFFHIPMEGKKVDPQAWGTVYISRKFKERLQQDSIEGNVCLDGKKYQIAGVFQELNKEGAGRHNTAGSVFLVNPQASTYLFKVTASGKTPEMVKRITAICRHYVPDTLPLDIRSYSQPTIIDAIEIMQKAFGLLAAISLLLVVLSIYSAISMDTITRQKEVAIRKINGATPKTIALLFGKDYLTVYLLAFATVYPLLRAMMINLTEGQIRTAYQWGWGIILFCGIASVIFAVTAHKIYRIMHINPAEVIKNE